MWQKYLYSVLKWIVREMQSVSASSRGGWISTILELSIFPIVERSGKARYSNITSSVAVPDCPLLLTALAGQIDTLDFGNLPLDCLAPVFKRARSPPTFLSDHSPPEKHQIIPIEPVSLDVFHSRLIWMKRMDLVRYQALDG